MNTKTTVNDFVRRCSTLLSEDFQVQSLTLVDQVLLEAYAKRVQEKFQFKEVL